MKKRGISSNGHLKKQCSSKYIYNVCVGGDFGTFNEHFECDDDDDDDDEFIVTYI